MEAGDKASRIAESVYCEVLLLNLRFKDGCKPRVGKKTQSLGQPWKDQVSFTSATVCPLNRASVFAQGRPQRVAGWGRVFL